MNKAGVFIAGLCLLGACIPDRKPIARLPEPASSGTPRPDSRPDADAGLVEKPRPTLAPPVSDAQLAAMQKACSEQEAQGDCLNTADHWLQRGEREKAFVYYDLACGIFLRKGLEGTTATGCQDARGLAPEARRAEYDVVACYTNNSSDHCQDLCAQEVGFANVAAFHREQTQTPPWWPSAGQLAGQPLFPSASSANDVCLAASVPAWIPPEKAASLAEWRTGCADQFLGQACGAAATAIQSRLSSLSADAALTGLKCAVWYAERACLQGRDNSLHCATAARLYGTTVGAPFAPEASLRSAKLGCLMALTEGWKVAQSRQRTPWRSFAGRSLTEFKCAAEQAPLSEGFATACPKIRNHMKLSTGN